MSGLLRAVEDSLAADRNQTEAAGDGFLLSRRPRRTPAGLDLVWRRTPQDAGHLREFAGRGDDEEREAVLRAFAVAEGETLTMDDAATGSVRRAVLKMVAWSRPCS